MRRERSATKGREVYISTSRSLLSASRDSIRPERILGISRTLPAEQGVRGCKAVNLSTLIETTANEENCRRRRGRDGVGWGRAPFPPRQRGNVLLFSPSPSLRFPLCVYLSLFLSLFPSFLAFDVPHDVYIPAECHEQLSLSRRCEKTDVLSVASTVR